MQQIRIVVQIHRVPVKGRIYNRRDHTLILFNKTSKLETTKVLAVFIIKKKAFQLSVLGRGQVITPLTTIFKKTKSIQIRKIMKRCFLQISRSIRVTLKTPRRTNIRAAMSASVGNSRVLIVPRISTFISRRWYVFLWEF